MSTFRKSFLSFLFIIFLNSFLNIYAQNNFVPVVSNDENKIILNSKLVSVLNNNDNNTQENEVKKKVLLEYFTGTWCGYCPRGALTLKKLMDKYPDIVPIAIHDDQAMGTNEGNIICKDFSPGYPQGMLDRVKFDNQDKTVVSDSYWESLYLKRLNTPTPVSIAVKHSYNNENRKLEITIDVEFVENTSGNFSINAYIIEDNVTGDNTYNQANYYNDNPNYPDLYKKGNPIPNYVHKYVHRQFLGGPYGSLIDETVSEIVVEKGQKFSKTYSIILSPDFDENEIYIAANIQKVGHNSITHEVLNSEFVKLNTSTSVNDIFSNTHNIELFPNPASEYLELRFVNDLVTEPSQIKIYNSLGEITLQTQISDLSEYKLDISNFPIGYYILRIQTENKYVSKSFMVIR